MSYTFLGAVRRDDRVHRVAETASAEVCPDTFSTASLDDASGSSPRGCPTPHTQVR
ncbi:MAG: hypothetical protein AVDCRST_MAG57-129 [uncultured Blastococcus sp.]|uniref:Uncharacterized protein n=1 Tax=uncultured Blastococcus sp. TaxID=217144 RepID=A0A6J4H309_9ACTN|nr:MAG: hypothetical protein AVDCRST_MAG57-129 [uncultured Blastococcus sp.]